MQNHVSTLSPEEAAQSGCLFVRYPQEILKQMLESEPFIVAKTAGRLVGYIFPMPNYFKSIYPQVTRRFEMIEDVPFEGRKIRDFSYIKIGQAAIAAEFRGKGIFKLMFDEMQRRYAASYELVLTRVLYTNPRSIAAHYKLGFVFLADGGEQCESESHSECGGTITDGVCSRSWVWMYKKWREP
jgi:hypothetical protein